MSTYRISGSNWEWPQEVDLTTSGNSDVVVNDIGTLLVCKDNDAPPDWNWDLMFAKEGDAGLDLPVLVKDVKYIKGYEGRVKENEWFDIPPGSTVEVPTGLRVKVPSDSWGNIRARSSTGFKLGLIVLDSVIDSGYTGPMYALVHNPLSEAVRIHQGQRLAQLVLIPIYPLKSIVRVNELPTTQRGDTGFGSSGK